MRFLCGKTGLAVRLKAVRPSRVLVERATVKPLRARRAKLVVWRCAGRNALRFALGAHSLTRLGRPVDLEFWSPSGRNSLRQIHPGRTSAFRAHVGQVVGLPADKQVVNVHASRGVARMANSNPTRKITMSSYPHSSVRIAVSPSHKDRAVAAVVLPAEPDQAPVACPCGAGLDSINSNLIHARIVRGIEIADPA